MNGAFVHLAVNHIPVVGVPIAFLLLLAGRARKSRDLVQAAFSLLVLMALVTVVAFKSGGSAAHTLKGIPGIERSDIHEHAEAADYAFWGTLVLGALALVGLWLSKRSEGAPAGLTALVLLGSLVLSVIFIRVAHLGGIIRHPEIASGYQPSAAEPAK